MIHDILFLPHGMQIVPEVETDCEEEFEKINKDLHKLMDKFINVTNDEVSKIVLITPHGYNLEKTLVIYHHSKFQGSIYQTGTENNVLGEEILSFQFDGDLGLSQKLQKQLGLNNCKFEVLIQGYSDYPLQLNWGEMVPLYYLRKYLNATYSILCYPRTRHSNLEQIDVINQVFAESLNQLDERILLVISGDLSHVHDINGPYGFDPVSKEFDELINTWAGSLTDSSMENITKLQSTGLACGYSGFNLIHHLSKFMDLELQYHFYYVPTYFGMAGYWWSVNDNENKRII